MNTEGVTVTLVLSLLVNVTVSPPLGAGEDRVTVIEALLPGPTIMFGVKPITPNCETRIVALPLV
jgi:hypothetical protein